MIAERATPTRSNRAGSFVCRVLERFIIDEVQGQIDLARGGRHDRDGPPLQVDRHHGSDAPSFELVTQNEVLTPGPSPDGEMADRKRAGIDSKLGTALYLSTVERAGILHQL